MSVSIQSVTFWLNVFLPWSLPGVTTTVQQGPYRGYSAIVGPERYCLTDQRGFSTDIRAESRMQSAMTVHFDGVKPILTQEHRCAYTIECDRIDGEVKARKKASTAHMQFTLASIEPIVTVRLNGAASNPCMSASWAFADIEYKGVIAINPERGSIAVDLLIGLFPAFEAYAAINNGPCAVIFRYAPSVRMPAVRMSPGATRPIRVQLEDSDGDSVFKPPGNETV